MTPLLNKYLERNPLRFCLEPTPPAGLFRVAVVIPAAGESRYLPATLNALAQNPAEQLAETLVLVVVNNAANAASERKLDNQSTLSVLRRKTIPGQERLKLCWIDAASPGYELRFGVGEARKTGMDSVLPFLDWNRAPLILCLDADTLVEPNYLTSFREAFDAAPDAAGAVMRFAHQPGKTAEEEAAIRAYENYMEHYVNRMTDAGSPYAYHAMGSAMACRAVAYLRSGGMKPRNAGEDFYFLQSLRKLGPVIPVDTSTVHPSSRPSDRVPFGTGATVRKITGGETRPLHHEEIFAMLKTICRTANTADTAMLLQLPQHLSALLPEPGQDFFADADFVSAWTKIAANTPKTEKHLRHAFHTWFDAFRTMKFIHFCEDNYPDRFPGQ